MRGTNWVGDGIMSLPALEALRARFPSAEIVLVVKPWVAELYEHHRAVTRLIIYDPAGEHHGLRGFLEIHPDASRRAIRPGHSVPERLSRRLDGPVRRDSGSHRL